MTIPGQQEATPQVVQRGRIRTLPSGGDRVMARRRVRRCVCTAVLIATLLTGVSVTAQLAAQVTNWPSEELSAADGRGPDLLDVGVNTVDETGSRWDGILPEQVCGISVSAGLPRRAVHQHAWRNLHE